MTTPGYDGWQYFVLKNNSFSCGKNGISPARARTPTTQSVRENYGVQPEKNLILNGIKKIPKVASPSPNSLIKVS